MRALTSLIYLVMLITSLVGAWILGVRMRRRIKRALGKDVDSEMELTSLNT
ncbi:MAG TPA: hypothetical protein VH088_21255 [Terriglobales bacterium]|nr:hypothetical protein [Terriglobales bacterium]